MKKWRAVLVAVFLGGVGVEAQETIQLGTGTQEFVEQAFADQTIHVDGLRFIHLESTSARFVGCQFSNVLVRANEAVLHFEDCVFIDTPETVILATACHATVIDCRFERTAEAINLIRSTGEISNSTFRQIRRGADAIDIDFDPVVPGWDPVRVANNLIDQCSGDGIDLGACQSGVVSNRIFNCADKGISIGEGSSGEIRGNFIQNARIGIAVKDGANPIVDENTLTHCRFGIRAFEKLNGSGGAYGEYRSNRFFACDSPFSSDLRSLPFESDSVLLTAFADASNDVVLHTNPPPVVINEVGHRMPLGRREFVELHNPTDAAIDLTGWALVDEAFHEFAPGTIIAPGGFHVVTFPLDSLADDVLVVRVVDTYQTDVDTVEIFPYRGWPLGNQTLELLDPSADNNDGKNWENAVTRTGTPNRPNSRTEPIDTPVSLMPVAITEIMYHPPGEENPTNEYIEITNFAPIPIDVTGWSLTDGVRETLPPGSILAPEERLVVHGPFFDGRLSNRGERLDLRDQVGRLVDRVDYLDRGEWPRQADGEGAALERLSSSLDSSQPQTWRAAFPGSPGQPNSVTNHADVAIHALAHRPVQPTPNEPIEVHVRTDGQPRLAWRVDPEPEWTTAPMTPLPSNMGANRWIATLPAQTDETLIEYRVIAADPDGLERVSNIQRVLVTTPEGRPEFDILMTEETFGELLSRSPQSDVLLPCTLVVGRQVYQRARVRYRGLTKRFWAAKSYRIDLRDDHPFGDDDRLNLNGKRPISEALGYAVFHQYGFRTPIHELVRARVAGGREAPLMLTERQYPDPAIEGWPPELDLAAWAGTVGSPAFENQADVANWIEWFALTAAIGDTQTLLNGVDGNHAVEFAPGQRVRLQPLDLDIAFANQFPPRSNVTIENSRLHPPPTVVLNDLPTRFLRHPEFQRAYYDHVLAIIDDVLLSPNFAAAADRVFADQPFSFLDTRAGVDIYLARDVPTIESEIRTLLDQTDWAPRPTNPVIYFPYPDFWIEGDLGPSAELFVDGQSFGLFTNQWCLDLEMGPSTQTLALAARPLTRRPWMTATNEVTLVYDPSDTDGNGLPASWESAFGLSNPAGDFDGDGLSNQREFERRSDPLTDSRLAIRMVRGANGLTLQWPSESEATLQRGFFWQAEGSVSGGSSSIDTSAPLGIYRLEFEDDTHVLPLRKRNE